VAETVVLVQHCCRTELGVQPQAPLVIYPVTDTHFGPGVSGMFLTEDTPLSSFRDGCGAKKLIFEMNDIGVIQDLDMDIDGVDILGFKQRKLA
jgi:hypothetical protein